MEYKFRALDDKKDFIYWDQFGNVIGSTQKIYELKILLETTGMWTYRKCNEQDLYEGDICEEFAGDIKYLLIVRFDKQTSCFGFDTYEYEIHESNYCEFEPLDNYFVNNMKIVDNIFRTSNENYKQYLIDFRSK